MNIIYIKQYTKVKVNKRDTEMALTAKLADIIGENVDNIEHCMINTSEIDGLNAGGSILLVSNKTKSKYIAVSIGASTKDIWCITDDGKDGTYSFEYVLQIDKKVFKDKSVYEALDESRNNKELLEALRMIGTVANNARFDGVLSGNYGEINDDNNNYKGILVVDYINSKTDKDIELEVIGRKGKLHLLQIVPVLKDEMEVVKLFEDPVMTEIIALAMCKDKKGTFNNRKKVFNFAAVLPLDDFTKEDCDKIGASIDKDGKFVITNRTQVENYLDHKF